MKKKFPKQVLIIIGVLLFLAVVQVIFSFPAPHESLVAVWDAGGFINFIAAVVFGIIAACQTNKATELSKIQLFSFVAIGKAMFAERSSEYPNYSNTRMEKDLCLSFLPNNDKIRCFHFDVEFENKNQFPINKLEARIDVSDCEIYGVVPEVMESVSFRQDNKCVIRFIIPCEVFMKNGTSQLTLNLSFCNIYSCCTEASLQFHGLINQHTSGGAYHDVKTDFILKQIAELSVKERKF